MKRKTDHTRKMYKVRRNCLQTTEMHQIQRIDLPHKPRDDQHSNSSHCSSRRDGDKLNAQKVQLVRICVGQQDLGEVHSRWQSSEALILLHMSSQEHCCHLYNPATCMLSYIFTTTTVQKRNQQLRRTQYFLLRLTTTLAYQSLHVEITKVYGAT